MRAARFTSTVRARPSTRWSSGTRNSVAPRSCCRVEPGLLTIRLESPGTVRGRVSRAGSRRAGVDVISVPAPEAYRAADDLVDVKGGDTRTGADGRFAVMVAAGGGGELRVGGGMLPIRRIPLPARPAPLLDLGDIDLGSPLELTIVLDQESPCDVRATGPIGQSGLQIVHGCARRRQGSSGSSCRSQASGRSGCSADAKDLPSSPPTSSYPGACRQGGALLRSLTVLAYYDGT